MKIITLIVVSIYLCSVSDAWGVGRRTDRGENYFSFKESGEQSVFEDEDGNVYPRYFLNPPPTCNPCNPLNRCKKTNFHGFVMNCQRSSTDLSWIVNQPYDNK